MKHTRITADGLIVENGKILLVKRRYEPFKDEWALPGGHIEYNEKVEEGVVREVKEETDLEVSAERIVGVYSKPGRDPRGHVVTVAYLCKAKSGKAKAGDDAKEAWWFPLEDLPKLAFDHREIVRDLKEELRRNVGNTNRE